MLKTVLLLAGLLATVAVATSGTNLNRGSSDPKSSFRPFVAEYPSKVVDVDRIDRLDPVDEVVPVLGSDALADLDG